MESVHKEVNQPQVLPEAPLSVLSVLCRICYDNDKEEPLIAPCNCKGTVAFVHRSCLERWLAESNTTTCELCHVIFKTERTPKYTSQQAVWRWLRFNPANGRGVRGDIIACTVITPLAILVTYVCLFSSDYYNQKKFITVPAARWTSVSLLIMIAIMLVGYYLWVYSVIRLHSRMWYNWWQRECIVRYIPPSSAQISIDYNTETINPSNTPNSSSSHICDSHNQDARVIEVEPKINVEPPIVLPGTTISQINKITYSVNSNSSNSVVVIDLEDDEDNNNPVQEKNV